MSDKKQRPTVQLSDKPTELDKTAELARIAHLIRTHHGVIVDGSITDAQRLCVDLSPFLNVGELAALLGSSFEQGNPVIIKFGYI